MTTAPVRPTTAVDGSLEHWASQRPDAIALIDGARQLSWSQWNAQADHLAAALQARGISAGDLVVVRTHSRLEWPVIAAALGKLGCSLLGLNYRLTASETRYVLNNSQAQVVICDDTDPAALLPAFEGQALKLTVSLDVAAPGFTTLQDLQAATPPGPAFFSAGDPPLVLYTSGTTGLPKGVLSGPSLANADQVLLEYLADVRSARETAADACFLVSMPMHHGSGPGQVWSAKRIGATVVLQGRFQPEETLGLIQRHQVTHWTGVPTMYKRIAALPAETIQRHDLRSLRQLTVGAAPVSSELKLWILQHLSENLVEGYGSTETGMITRMPAEMQRSKPGSSGLPYKHVRIQIRDEDGHLMPAGEVGEIWAWTPVNIRSYLNAPLLGTDTLDDQGFFRTGDMGRLDADGCLWISDRAKDMVIAGGVNIYPAEIEAALLTHPALADAAVIGIPDDEMGERVMAFCEPKPGQTVTEAELLAHCAQHLATYKRPRAIRIVAELPRNTVGKLLKRELRAPFWQDRERQV